MSFLIPTRFRELRKIFGNREFNLLDVGCGSHSATLTKSWFPHSNYFGIDRTRNYQNDESDFQLMSGFFELDLTKLEFNIIPDAQFDVIIMSHVIEHLHNGDEVLTHLLPKLKLGGGYIYIEFPSRRSTKFPSKRGTLNFYDDETHCRIYTVDEISEILLQNGCKVLKGGVRRDWVRVIMMPFKIIYSKVKLGYVTGEVFWDLLGFADFVFACKVNGVKLQSLQKGAQACCEERRQAS